MERITTSGCSSGDVDPAHGQHLEGDKAEDAGEPVVQQVEAIEHGGEGKVKRAQAKDRENV